MLCGNNAIKERLVNIMGNEVLLTAEERGAVRARIECIALMLKNSTEDEARRILGATDEEIKKAREYTEK